MKDGVRLGDGVGPEIVLALGPAIIGNARYLRALRQVAIAKGLCYVCRARPVEPGKRHCQACLYRSKATKQANVDAGLCRCGRKPAPGIDNCQRCSDRHAKRAKKVRVENVEQGICALSGCGSPAHPERTLCCVHLDLQNIAAKVRRAERKAAGICTVDGCGKRAKKEHTLCRLHLDEMRDAYWKRKAATP